MFNPLRNVLTAPGAIPEGSKTSGLAELVGSATRSLKNCPVEINLLPPAVRAARETTRKLPRLALAALFFIATPVLWWLHLDRQATRVSEESATLEAEASRKERLAQGIASALTEKDALATEAAPFLLVAAERSAWASILDELADKLPDRFIWVTQLKPVIGPITPPDSKDKKAAPPRPGAPTTPRPADLPQGITAIEINGLYLDNPPNSKGAGVIDEFFTNLKPSPVFAIGDDMAQVITKRTTPTGEAWAYDYTLLLPLKQPIRLP
jgi:Tfp pilus assembly protein PilN